MDTEILKNIAVLLTLGVSFYVMMRHGCCSHAGSHGATPHGQSGSDTTDPVCGMAVDPHNAPAHLAHEGRDYYFCSAGCRDRFAKAPSRYLRAGAQRSCH